MRSEYAHTVVLWLSFWLQSTNTRPGRLSLAMSTVTRFGSRDSRSWPSASANRFVSSCVASNVFSGTERCSPFPPEVFTTAHRSKWPRMSRSSHATRPQSRTPARGPGSRSSTTAVGCQGSASVHWCVCSSSAARFASHTSAGGLRDDATLLAAARYDRLRRDPVGMVRRAPLLEEPLAVRPVGRPDEGRGPAREVGEDDRPDAPVIVDDLGFSEARGGVEDLVEVRQRELPTLDLYLYSRSPYLESDPMPSSIWTGTISFGLVQVPVRIVTATRSKDVSFNQLEEGTGARIRYRKVSDVTGDEVTADKIVRGYEVSKGKYVLIEDEEIQSLRPKGSHAIEIEEFVDLDEIDPLYFEQPYYLIPDARGSKPYKLLTEAMTDLNKVAIGRIVMRSKERLVAIRPLDGMLCIETMRYADEVVARDKLAARRRRRRRAHRS